MRSLLPQALPVLLQGGKQGGVVRLFDARSCQDDNIQPLETIPLPAKTFPDQALYAVAIHRAADMLLGYCQSQPGRFPPVVAPCEHGKISVRGTYRSGEYLFIIPDAQQPGTAGKTFSRDRLPAQGVRRARPLARRALMTLRPLLVAMRARKPWVRARLRLLG